MRAGVRFGGLMIASLLGWVSCATGLRAELSDVPPHQRTADLPDSWLVLYNTSSTDSIAWAAWYQAQWQIPDENMLGLAVTVNEHLPTLDSVQGQIVRPVRELFAAQPDLEARVMGILLGYRMPGHYATPPAGGPGGFSISDALQDMYDDSLSPSQQKGYNWDCPAMYGLVLPSGGRLTKATMAPRKYMTARIDTPTLDDAMMLTVAAEKISGGFEYCNEQYLWYDYRDPIFPSGIWYWLQAAVSNPMFAEVPWREFDSDYEQSPNDALRFDAHDCDGWDDNRLFGQPAGLRVLAFNYNSWGATTVRSRTEENARFVPNALAAGYAAAIGSTGEPYCCQSPIPATLIASLREGWTLGEAFYLANPFNDWMWTLVGDPLLRMAHWFDDVPPQPAGVGDINGDGAVDGRDIAGFVGVWTGTVTDPAARAQADLNGDGVVDDTDLFLLNAPLLYETANPEVLRGSGDANGDGIVNGDDIPVFIDRLFNGFQGGETLRQLYGPDMNRDGQVTVEDIPLFVDALLGIASAPGGQPVASGR